MREHRIPTNGDYAKRLRGTRSLESVALDAGVTERVVRRIESGEGSVEDRIRKVAGFYGVNYEDLLAGSPESAIRPEPKNPVDATVVLNIELRGGRRESVAITFGLEDAVNTHFRINLRDSRTGSLILDIQCDCSDLPLLLHAFGVDRLDDFACDSISFSRIDALISMLPMTEVYDPLLPVSKDDLIRANALLHLFFRDHPSLKWEVTGDHVTVSKRSTQLASVSS